MIVLMLIVCTVSHAQTDSSEWQLVVPETEVEVLNVHAGPGSPMIIDAQGNAFEFDLGSYLPFDLDDNTAINAISFRESDDLEPVLLIAFSSAIDNYLPGDVLSCQNQNCDVFFSPQLDLGVSDAVMIDAMSSANSYLTFVSFNVGFNYLGEYIDPADLYNLLINNSSVSLIKQTDTMSMGFNDTTNLNAFDFNSDGQNYTRYFGGSTPFREVQDQSVNTNQLLLINGPAIFRVPFDLPEGIRRISAYSALNSGYLGFETAAVQVAESAGSLAIGIERVSGNDNYMQVVIESSDVSAQNGEDYLYTPEVSAWLDDESDLHVITVPILDNQVIDGNKSFTLNLFAGSEYTSLSSLQRVITVTILDDEASDLIFKNGFE